LIYTIDSWFFYQILIYFQFHHWVHYFIFNFFIYVVFIFFIFIFVLDFFMNLIFPFNSALQFNIWWYLRFNPRCFDFWFWVLDFLSIFFSISSLDPICFFEFSPHSLDFYLFLDSLVNLIFCFSILPFNSKFSFSSQLFFLNEIHILLIVIFYPWFLFYFIIQYLIYWDLVSLVFFLCL
jgi:hypothetical protein